jgi:hypothetical protein
LQADAEGHPAFELTMQPWTVISVRLHQTESRRSNRNAYEAQEGTRTMTDAFKKGLRRMSATLAALAVAFTITGVALAGSAAAAPAPEDDMSVQALTCSKGTGSTQDGGTTFYHAWGRCSDDFGGQFYRFRVNWSCTGESWIRHTSWAPADERRITGLCPGGKRVDSHSVETDYIGS